MNKLSGFAAVFARWGVARQLGTAFTVLLLLTAVLGALSVWSLARVNDRASEVAVKWLAGVGHLAEVRLRAIEVRDLEIKHSRTSDRSYHSEYEQKMTESAKALNVALADYATLVRSEDERKMLAALQSGWAAFHKASDQVVAHGKAQKQTDAADISDGAASMTYDALVGALDALIKFDLSAGQLVAASAQSTYEQAKITVLGLLTASLVLGAGMALLITRRLIGQLGGEPDAAVRVAQAVAAGDLSTSIPLKAGDTQSLMASLQAMQAGLADTVRQVRQGSEGVANASSEIADGNLDLSGRTEQQASALQQTAATMDELGTTVRHNADNARQANTLAQGAAAVAAKGGDMVGQVVQTMKGINDSSRKIADIIGTIDGIAFQTNILALNAAVEAARAGEQGRGFAVVASEVRSLAQRSAAAAREIKTLISASVERVEQGTAQVDQAGRTMEEIVSAIQRVSAIVGEISAASVEQSTGVNQVSQAVTQMDHATQQNAALVEESAAAAASLRQQAQQLVQSVAVFKI